MKKFEVLKKYFGYEKFRQGQENVIDKILSGKEVLGIMPTGAGKSLCFQVPALCMDGVTIVVSPLISLMKDQVRSLVQAGIRAAYINSSLTYNQYLKAMENARDGVYKIIYVAPERLVTEDFIAFAKEVKISMLTVDEAHCISQWGNDFRPSYAKIPEFIEAIGYRPLINAFTATATEKVKLDICRMLGMKPDIIVTGFDRENLYFEVRRPESKQSELIKILREHISETGIIYCNTRKNVDMVYEFLSKRKMNAVKYHAGLSDEERKVNQDTFLYGDDVIMVATNAFGMGIDKPDVRFVIHYNMPKDMESYYQEAGRAGRDGEKAVCIMLFSYQDVIMDKYLIEQKEYDTEDENQIEQLKAQDMQRLDFIKNYSNTAMCLRKSILGYFGEHIDDCKNCGNCNSKFRVSDEKKKAKAVISCISGLRTQFGKVMIADILCGNENDKIEEWGLDRLESYGVLSFASVKEVRAVIDEMIFRGYLEISAGYPTLSVTQKGLDFYKSDESMFVHILEKVEKKKETVLHKESHGLFGLLREERARIAKVQGVPAFVVFSDASLHDMCRKLPVNKAEFLNVSGVGTAKADKYGKQFINIIKKYKEGI